MTASVAKLPRSQRPGRSNTNERGSSYTRRARRKWLVEHFGDGATVKCSHCPAVLTEDEVTPDRVVPGYLGGTYRRTNIIPSCLPCACRQGAKITNELKKARKEPVT